MLNANLSLFDTIKKFACFILCISFNLGFVYAQGVDLLTELNIKGELTQGSAIRGHIPHGASLQLNGALVETTGQGGFFIGFGRDAARDQTLTLIDTNGNALSQTLALSERVYKIQTVNGVPSKTVSPSQKHLKRIRSESALVKSARAKISQQTAFMDDFIVPMKGPITGVYGSQRVYNGVPKRPHYGVDYAGPVGALVSAPAAGLVTLTHDDMFYSGGTLIIDHGYGVSSSFLHLSEILVKEGQYVKQGDPIAKVGKGGRATGPHLDWRMNWYDVRIDPLKVLKLSE